MNDDMILEPDERPTPDRLRVCQVCGVVIGDLGLHEAWHARGESDV